MGSDNDRRFVSLRSSPKTLLAFGGLALLAFVAGVGPSWQAVTGAPLKVYYDLNKCDTGGHVGCLQLLRARGARATCLGNSICASTCVFCRWGREESPCQTSVTAPFSLARSACPALSSEQAVSRKVPRVRGCLEEMSLRPDPEQQLNGDILEEICHEMRSAQARSASEGGTGGANVLIFSLGHDSPMWLDMNPHGLTRFVETSPAWIEMQPPRVKNVTILADYGTSASEGYGIRCDPHRLGHFLRTQLSPQLLATCWDIILVDAPNGWGPGRMGAIYAASQLAGDSTVIFVDDCERMLEGNYALWYLSQGRELRVIDNGHGAITCMMYTAVK